MNLALFPIGPFSFSTGGTIFLFGVISATWVLTRTVHEKELSLMFLYKNLFLFAGVAFVAGRLGEIFKFWSHFQSESNNMHFFEKTSLFLEKFFFFWHGGLDPFWTALGFLAVFFLVAYRQKEDLWKWLDAFVLPTILLLIFWSIGSFFSGWGYGKPVSDGFFLGITYAVQEVRYAVPLHPVQLYTALYYGFLFYVGLRWWRSDKFQKHGTFFAALVFLVFFGNTMLEFFRGDSVPTFSFWFFEDLRISQVLSFFCMLGSGFFLLIFTHPEILPHHNQRRMPQGEKDTVSK